MAITARGSLRLRRMAYLSRMVVKSTATRLAVVAAVLLLAVPVAAQAQQAAKVYRIGFVSPASPNIETSRAFRQGIRELGYVEGRNVIIEARYAEGQSERLPDLVAEVLRLKVDVLVVASTPGALAAKSATTTVPIVFAGIIDPVGLGIVASLARPGGNITGVTWGIGGEGFAGKLVELLKEAALDVSHVAVLWNSANPVNATQVREVQAAARTLNVRIDVLDAGTPTKLDAAFAAIGASRARGIIVMTDPFFYVVTNRAKLVQFAASKRLVAMYFAKEFVDAGGLMSYGGNLADSFRRAATYVDRILKGAKPVELPIERPTKFELIINLKTAKALGLTIPQRLLVRVDQVIE